MANIYPNSTASAFCAWILANSNIRPTSGRKVQIQNVQTAANTASYVTQLYFEEFVAYTNQWYDQWLQYVAMQPYIAPPTVSTYTTAWLAALPNVPTQATQYAVDAFFKQLVADGNMLLDYFFLFAQDNQPNNKISLINPTLYAITEHNTPTWTANLGYTGNGTSTYLSVNYTESVNASQYTLNNNSIGTYNRLNTGVTGASEIGTYDGTNETINRSRNTATAAYIGNSSGTGANPANTQMQGLIVNTRKASGTAGLAINGVVGATSTIASAALVTKQDNILCQNGNGTQTLFSTNQISLAFRGNGNINQVTFNSAVNLLMTNLGAHY